MRFNFICGTSIFAVAVGAAIPAHAQISLPVELPVEVTSSTLTAGEPVTGPVTSSDPVYSPGEPPAPEGTTVGVVTETRTTSANYSDSGSGSTWAFGQNVEYGYNQGASVSGTEAQTQTTTSTPNGEGGFNVTGPVASGWTASGDSTVSDVSVNASASSDITGMVSGQVWTTESNGNTASLEASGGMVTTSGTIYANATGTATFDPSTGGMTTTLDSVTGTVMTADGVPAFQADPTGTASTTLNANRLSTTAALASSTVNTALINGTGEDGALVLHGGTSSTTVTLDNSGINVVDTTSHPGGLTTLSLDNDGNLAIAGALSANGINNNGNVISNVADGVLATDAATVGQVANEATARIAGDAATLASAKGYTDTSVSAEAAARSAADTAEANARIAADTAEANARIAGDNALRADLTAETNARVAMGTELRDRIASSTATAIALGGTAILPDTNFTLAGNVGFYQGAQALAVNAAARVAPHTYLTGAFGGGLNKHGEIGGRVGFVFGF